MSVLFYRNKKKTQRQIGKYSLKMNKLKLETCTQKREKVVNVFLGKQRENIGFRSINTKLISLHLCIKINESITITEYIEMYEM